MKIFVANKGDDTISLIKNDKTKTFLKLTQNENVQIGPHRLLIDKYKKELFTLNIFDDSISVIDIKNFQLIDTVYVGPSPNDGIILNNLIYVLNGDADCLSVFDIGSSKILEQIKVGFQPQSILYSKKHKKIFVSNMNSDSISLINPLNLHIEKTLSVYSKPYGMCLSDDEKFLFIANTYLETGLDGSITIYDIINNEIIDNIQCGRLPISIAFHNGFIFVVNSCSNTLMKINLQSRQCEELYCGYMPVYIKIFKDFAYVSVSGENKLIIVNINNFKIEKIIEVGKEPDGLIFEV